MDPQEVDPQELERIRRSIAMLPPGHPASALAKEAPRALIDEVATARPETQRYRRAVASLRRVLEAIETEF